MIVRLLVSINTVYFVVIDTLHIVLYSCYHLLIVISVVINIAKYIANTVNKGKILRGCFLCL